MIESEALADTASGELRPFLWEDGEMVDLGTLDGTGGYEWPGTVAWGINNRGQVVGWSRTGVDPRVLVGGGGRMTDLGTLGGRESAARVINNRGQVAGFSDTASLEPHVVLWSKK